MFNEENMDLAARDGHLDAVKWLHENSKEGCTKLAMDNAARNGHLEVVKWLHENRTEGCTTDAMDFTKSLEVIKWLHENRKEGCTTRAMDFAAANGNLEIVKWLHTNRKEGCSTNAMDFAAWNGHLEVVKWLHYNRTEGCTKKAMDLAAYNGYLEIIEWLHTNRTEGCSTNAMNSAAINRHLEVVKWFEKNHKQTMLMLETDNSTEELLLVESDFPSSFHNMAHPNDFESVTSPFLDYITHSEDGHNRIIVRACFDDGDGKFIPMSFVCNTGAPHSFYLSERGSNLLKSLGRIKNDELDNSFIILPDGFKAKVQKTPQTHKNANIMGIRLLSHFRMKLTGDDLQFSFENWPGYL